MARSDIEDEAGADLSIDTTTGEPEESTSEPRPALRLYWYGARDARTKLLDADGRNLLDLLPVASVGFELGAGHETDIVIRIEAKAVEILGSFR
jgi:hypothetical protein